MFIAVVSYIVMAFSIYTYKCVPKMFASLINSSSETDRKQAYDYAMKHIVGIERVHLRCYLVAIIVFNPQIGKIGESIDSEQNIYSPRRIALSITAEWSDKVLIDLLIKYIDYYAPDPRLEFRNSPVHLEYSAAKGLINIGVDSIEKCLYELSQIDNGYHNVVNGIPLGLSDQRAMIRQRNILYVVCKIIGFDAAVALLDKEINKMNKLDTRRSDNLKMCRLYLKSIVFKRTVCAR